MFERKNRDKNVSVAEAVMPSAQPEAEIDALADEIEALDMGGSPSFTGHKYRRVDAGGWTCGHCKKHIADPGLILEKTCPQA